MGKLPTITPSTLTHLHLHPHPLHLLTNCPSAPPPCSACKLPLSGQLYSCPSCNFFLHLKCAAQTPPQIRHPFHPPHVFTLLPTPLYPEGSFNCDACGQNGDGFSYHCGICSVDLHVHCASTPLTVSRNFHPHPLQLAFLPPYGNGGFSCDVCRKPGSKTWIYRCGICEFDCHLGCANSSNPSAPAPASVSIQQMRAVPPIAQTRTIQIQPGSMGVATPLFRPSRMAVLPLLPPPPPLPLLLNPPNYGFGVATATRQQNRVMGNGIVSNAFHGIVDGASQTAGQQLLQNLFGGGGGGGGGNMLQALTGGGGGGNMLQTLMGGDGGGNMVQALMGGGADGSGLVMDGGDFAANLFS